MCQFRSLFVADEEIEEIKEIQHAFFVAGSYLCRQSRDLFFKSKDACGSPANRVRSYRLSNVKQDARLVDEGVLLETFGDNPQMRPLHLALVSA